MTNRTRASTTIAIVVLVLFNRLPLQFVDSPAFAQDEGMRATAVPTASLASRDASPTTPQADTATGDGALVTPDLSSLQSNPAALPLTPAAPVPLIAADIPLRGAPVEVPLELRIPALDIRAPVLGVGLTATNAMAAPIGMREDDPVWQSVFWYRGGGIPGEAGTTTIAGHYDTEAGLPAVFAFLEDMRVGDLVIVHDQRSGVDIPYIVTETATYTNEEASDPAVLARIFGAGAVGDADSQPASDHLSHLTLITCAGAWVDGTFDLRFVVYAVRASYPPGVGHTND